MNHTRQETRANNWKHAIRKRKIAREVLNFNYYDNLHQYSKNKIHCSCPLCRQKKWEYGNNSVEQRKISERRKIEQMETQKQEGY